MGLDRGLGRRVVGPALGLGRVALDGALGLGRLALDLRSTAGRVGLDRLLGRDGGRVGADQVAPGLGGHRPLDHRIEPADDHPVERVRDQPLGEPGEEAPDQELRQVGRGRRPRVAGEGRQIDTGRHGGPARTGGDRRRPVERREERAAEEPADEEEIGQQREDGAADRREVDREHPVAHREDVQDRVARGRDRLNALLEAGEGPHRADESDDRQEPDARRGGAERRVVGEDQLDRDDHGQTDEHRDHDPPADPRPHPLADRRDRVSPVDLAEQEVALGADLRLLRLPRPGRAESPLVFRVAVVADDRAILVAQGRQP